MQPVYTATSRASGYSLAKAKSGSPDNREACTPKIISSIFFPVSSETVDDDKTLPGAFWRALGAMRLLTGNTALVRRLFTAFGAEAKATGAHIVSPFLWHDPFSHAASTFLPRSPDVQGSLSLVRNNVIDRRVIKAYWL
jgi:hypothetical protein